MQAQAVAPSAFAATQYTVPMCSPSVSPASPCSRLGHTGCICPLLALRFRLPRSPLSRRPKSARSAPAAPPGEPPDASGERGLPRLLPASLLLGAPAAPVLTAWHSTHAQSARNCPAGWPEPGHGGDRAPCACHNQSMVVNRHLPCPCHEPPWPRLATHVLGCRQRMTHEKGDTEPYVRLSKTDRRPASHNSTALSAAAPCCRSNPPTRRSFGALRRGRHTVQYRLLPVEEEQRRRARPASAAASVDAHGASCISPPGAAAALGAAAPSALPAAAALLPAAASPSRLLLRSRDSSCSPVSTSPVVVGVSDAPAPRRQPSARLQNST